MQNEFTKQRLYFTKEKICIGSYDEVAQYESKTGQSYWASDFFDLPPDYSPIGEPLDAIEAVQNKCLKQKLYSSNG